MGALDGIQYGAPPAPAAPDTGASPLDGITYGAAPAEPPGVVESAARGAAQGASFGFADEISGALEAAFTGKKYAQARDESRANFHAAEEAHPIAYGAGELAGGVGTALIPTGAAFKAVGLGAKAVEGAEAIGGAARVAHDVGTGAAFGAAQAAGSSEAGVDSKAGGFGQLVSDMIRGAATGGATNAVAAPIARKLVEGAPKRASADLMEAVTGNTPAKFAKKVAADAKDIEDTLFLPQNKAILKNLGNTEKVIPLTDGRMEAVGKQLDTLKTELDETLSSTVYGADKSLEKERGRALARPGKMTRTSEEGAISGEIGGARQAAQLAAPEETALARQDKVATRPGPEYTPPPGEADYLPPPTTVEGRAVPKTIDLQPEAIAGGAKLGDITKPIVNKLAELGRQPGNQLEENALNEMLANIHRTWGKDPGIIVPTRDLRAYTTKAQRLASNTIGTINESLASELKHDLSETVTKIMNDHLDRAAAASPQAAEIVAKMRTLNTEYSALANMQDAFRGSAWKEITKRKSASTLLGDGAHKLGLTGAFVALAAGHPLAAGAAVAAPAAAKGLDKLAVAGNRWLATVSRAAQAGATKAQLIKLAVEKGAPLATAQFVAARLATGAQ